MLDHRFHYLMDATMTPKPATPSAAYTPPHAREISRASCKPAHQLPAIRRPCSATGAAAHRDEATQTAPQPRYGRIGRSGKQIAGPLPRDMAAVGGGQIKDKS